MSVLPRHIGEKVRKQKAIIEHKRRNNAEVFYSLGVGKAIVESLINLGTTKWDMKSIDLNVEDDNPEAKRFYSSLNFTTIPGSQGFGSEMMILDVAQ